MNPYGMTGTWPGVLTLTTFYAVIGWLLYDAPNWAIGLAVLILFESNYLSIALRNTLPSQPKLE